MYISVFNTMLKGFGLITPYFKRKISIKVGIQQTAKAYKTIISKLTLVA